MALYLVIKLVVLFENENKSSVSYKFSVDAIIEYN